MGLFLLCVLLFLEISNWRDGIVIGRLWVGRSMFWILPGIEDIPFVKPWRAILVKRTILSVIWFVAAAVITRLAILIFCGKGVKIMNQNAAYRVKTDGFHGDLFCPAQDAYPGKALICFSGSDGRFELTRRLAAVFQAHGLTVLALAYVMEEGLPDQFYHVPIDTLEAAAKRLHDMGYEKVGLWGISKGAELALTAGSLLPGLVNAVAAAAPISTVCQGFTKKKGITLLPGSSWRFHGEELPYTSFGLKKFPLGHVLQKSLIARELTMYDLYLPVVQKPNPAAVIKAEKITGPVLLISSGMDTMWTSELAAEQVMDRLRQHSFPYFCQHLRYDYGGRLFVPVEFWMTKLFKGDRGQNREPGRKARMDSLTKTLEFVSQW